MVTELRLRKILARDKIRVYPSDEYLTQRENELRDVYLSLQKAISR